MKPLKIFLLLLLVVTVICNNDRYSQHKEMAFYDEDWEDEGDDADWEDDDDDYDYDDDDDDYDDGDEKYDKSWKDKDEDYDDSHWKKKKKPYDHHYYLPPPRKPMLSITTRPPHQGNYNDGYNNGYNAGLLDPNNRNHTIEYIRTATDCGISKRVDVIDGVSYTFSTMTTVGPFGVTRTEVVLDSSTILLPYTGADKMMSTIPLGGVTRTVVEVEDEATTLPIRIRPTPQPVNDRMLEGIPNDMGLVAIGDERRMALDAMPYGKSQALAVGDDGISGTVLRHIKFDSDGNPIIPSNAGTRPVYVINDRTTTLRNGIPLSFPVDNGHTRTVVALRSGVLTLPLTGGDEITKLLPLDGLTETVVVFDEMTYTLSPDDDTSSHPTRSVPSKIVHTVVVEEIWSSTPTPSPSSPPQAPTAAAATISGIIGAGILNDMFQLPPKTILPSQSVDVPIASKTTPPLSTLEFSPSSALTFSPSSSLESHCSTKWILEKAQKPEGCYLLSSVVGVDKSIRDVETQGYWTTSQCHSFCSNSTQLPSFNSWYYGVTLSAESTGNTRSSTCRCMADLSSAEVLDNCHTISLQNNETQSLGLVYPESESSSIFIYQATYRCLLPSLKKRSSIAPPDAWRCHPTETNKRKSEGCYPYLTPKVTIRKSRTSADGMDWYWTAARCYSFCLESGRVPTRSKWYYGITLGGTTPIQNDCLCMLDMGAPPTSSGCQDLPFSTDTKIGIVNQTAIYAYEVDYTCSSSCNATFKISDTKATEGCYPLSNYADRAINKVSRPLSQGIYTSDECFHICNNSGLIVPGQAWWYGISMSDPADTRKGTLRTSSCRCSIKAPSLSRHNFLAGRCNHQDVGLVDNRFMHRINNGVYVYKVSYQCPDL